MATGKYGSQSISFLVDGYSLIANKLKGLRYKQIAKQERSDGLGDSWEETTPTGMSSAELAQDGAFFDTAGARIHAAMSAAVPTSPQATQRVVCLGFAGQTLGESFVGAQGYSEAYEVLAQLGLLTKANVIHRISGQLDTGVILHALAAQTQDFIGTVYDSTAQSTNGGAGYLQVTESFGTSTFKIQHSSDNATWVDLVTFAATTSAPSAQCVTVTGTVWRYLRVFGTLWGTVSPSASISPSASRSPSASISPSASTSLSPSASISPSASTSLSPSSSLSPSTSRSPSMSASVSASASRSPSASVSPSVSSSASVSPSTAAGAQGTATVFIGFARR